MKVPSWIKIAINEIGVCENPGANSNPLIEQYHAYTNAKGSDDSVPWCSSFVNYCTQKSGFGGTFDAKALSWLNWGIRCSIPVLFSVAVIDYGNGKGHVGFLVGVSDTLTSVYLLGGNQKKGTVESVNITKFKANVIEAYLLPKGFNVYG